MKKEAIVEIFVEESNLVVIRAPRQSVWVEETRKITASLLETKTSRRMAARSVIKVAAVFIDKVYNLCRCTP
jgi:hypothetical protein